jgi:hypothetical protein
MRRDGTMRLADFVSAILHLTMAFELFKAKDTNQDNQIKMNLNEVTNEILQQFNRKTIIIIIIITFICSGLSPCSFADSSVH